MVICAGFEAVKFDVDAIVARAKAVTIFVLCPSWRGCRVVGVAGAVGEEAEEGTKIGRDWQIEVWDTAAPLNIVVESVMEVNRQFSPES